MLQLNLASQNICIDKYRKYLVTIDITGSIVAWVTKPNADANSSTAIPDGWILCDGR